MAARLSPEKVAETAKANGWAVWRLTPVSVVVYRDPDWSESAYAGWPDGRLKTARVTYGPESGKKLSGKKLLEHLESSPGEFPTEAELEDVA